MISIVLSRNSPHPADGESSKISPSAQACPAATRQNDAKCLVGGIKTGAPRWRTALSQFD
jgi:hypothetical protein